MRTMNDEEAVAPPGTQTLARGLVLVDAVSQGVSDLRGLVAYTGIGRSTVHRLVQLLVRVGYLRRIPENEYGLGPKLVQLGFQALEANPLTTVATHYLEGLSAQVHDTVHLGIEDHEEVLYLAKLPGSRGAEMRSRIGMRAPMTRTGLGKAMLLDAPDRWVPLYNHDTSKLAGSDSGVGAVLEAGVGHFLSQMRSYQRVGVAFDIEENEPGIRCIAVPIRGATRAICGAISVSATRPYMPMRRLRALVPLVRRTANDIGAELGYRPGPG